MLSNRAFEDISQTYSKCYIMLPISSHILGTNLHMDKSGTQTTIR